MAQPPLCVDLDGSLIKTDSLHEALIVALRTNPALLIFAFFSFVRAGKSGLKTYLAENIQLKIHLFPFNKDVVSFIQEEKKSGRTIFLVTGAAQRWADSANDHLKLFDACYGSQPTLNLTAKNKARFLVERFGPHGYDYIGDSRQDEPVWAQARQKHIVTRKLRPQKTWTKQFIGSTGFSLIALVKALRPHQWAKNLLVFIPILLAHRYFERSAWQDSFVTFVSFSLIASSVYLINDLFDLDSDRIHLRKKSRPFASGHLALAWGLVLSPVLLLSGLALSLLVSPYLTALLTGYFILTSLYSFWLKRVVLLDILILSGLYTIRVLAGHIGPAIQPSYWLLLFTTFFFFSLACLKRFIELHSMRDSGKIAGRGYLSSDFEMIRSLGTTSGMVAVLIFGLYLDSVTSQAMYHHNFYLWGICPVLLFWISYIWLKGGRNEMHDDPIVFALRDRVSLALGLVTLVLLGLAV